MTDIEEYDYDYDAAEGHNLPDVCPRCCNFPPLPPPYTVCEYCLADIERTAAIEAEDDPRYPPDALNAGVPNSEFVSEGWLRAKRMDADAQRAEDYRDTQYYGRLF